MALIAFCSIKGSAGTTTTALALTKVWPTPALLVEADPLGGTILPGYFEGMLTAPADLLGLVNLARRGAPPEQLRQLAVTMDPLSHKLLIPGMTDPCAQGQVAAGAWPDVAGLLNAVADRDVLVDCGRVSHPYAPLPVLAVADVIAVVTGSSLPDLYSLQRHLPTLQNTIVSAAQTVSRGTRRTGQPELRLFVVETTGRHSATAVAAATGIDAVGLPFDPRAAAVFSQGRSAIPGRRHNAYLHKLHRLAPALRALTARPAGKVA